LRPLPPRLARVGKVGAADDGVWWDPGVLGAPVAGATVVWPTIAPLADRPDVLGLVLSTGSSIQGSVPVCGRFPGVGERSDQDRDRLEIDGR
jgi:hypothetical protein